MLSLLTSIASAQSIFDVVANSSVHTTLARLVGTLPEVANVLRASGQLTLLAPTDEAFTKFSREAPEVFQAVSSNATLLTQVLQYHVIPGSAFNPAQAPKRSFPKTALGPPVRIDVDGSKVTINFGLAFSNVTSSVNATNGVVHVIDGVLVPPIAPASSVGTTAGFTSLVAAVNKTGLGSTIDGLKDVTIFAPTNKAFDDLNAFAQASKLTITEAILSSTLKLHIIEGIVYSTDIAASKTPLTPKTIQGANLNVAFANGGITVAGPGNKTPAKVTEGDIIFGGGVIHVIDTVLLPNLNGNVANNAVRSSMPYLFVAAIACLI